MFISLINVSVLNFRILFAHVNGVIHSGAAPADSTEASSATIYRHGAFSRLGLRPSRLASNSYITHCRNSANACLV